MEKIKTTQPFVYRLIWTKQNKTYVGFKWAEGCSIDDLATVYFSSSKEVQKFRQRYGDPDIVKIIKAFGVCNYLHEWKIEGTAACDYEHEFLKSVDAKNDYSYLNKDNGGWKPTFRLSEETKEKLSAAKTGDKNPNYGKKQSAEHRAKNSAAKTGKKRPAETREKIRKTLTGKPKPKVACSYCQRMIGINNIANHERSCKALIS